MSKSSEAVIKWRKKTKQRIIDSMGGKCIACGYCRCNDAMELHHIDPTEKEFSLGGSRANIRSWAKIVDELRKCVLFCAICHREFHAGLIEINFANTTRFDETFADYKKGNTDIESELLEESVDFCPICNVNKLIKGNLTCSYVCAAKKNRKVDWDSIDVMELQKTMSNVKIGELLGVSDVAVAKRVKKLMSINPNQFY